MRPRKPTAPLTVAAAAAAALGLVAQAARAQTPAGGPVRVNTAGTSDSFYPSVSMGPDGASVVVWHVGGIPPIHVRGQRFDRAGARLGDEFQVDEATHSNFSAVAIGADGGFMVAWRDDTTPTRIRARLFDALGQRRGSELQVSQSTGSASDGYPNVVADVLGHYLVVWDRGTLASSDDFVARRFGSQGQPLGDEIVVNTYTTGEQDFGDVSVDQAGRFVVAWSSRPGPNQAAYAVVAQRLDAAGAALGANFIVNAYTSNVQAAPAIAHQPDGGFVIAFRSNQGNGSDVYARRYDASGNGVGGEFQVNTYTTSVQSYPDIAMDGGGSFVVVWGDYGDGNGIKGQRFHADGSPRGSEFRVATGQLNAFGHRVASDALGNFVVEWMAGANIMQQRYGGLFPAGLQVDTAGNNVWEPGETVDVRPRWLNLSGAVQTVGGTLSSLEGPAGATYAITDGGASYAPIPTGQSAPCTDCYAVGVTAPASRPAAHWDARVVETMTPDAQGQQKAWTLHIGDSFADVARANGYNRFIETLLHRGITAGCGGGNYCPAASTARDQMAVFVLVSKEGPAYAPPDCTTPMFNDVPASSPFCRWVEELARRGVVAGCGSGSYCPSEAVTREQMAVFLVRTLDPALNPPPCTSSIFLDVPASSPFCRWITELAQRGITAGCGGGNYCPGQPVTRDQMAAFLAATFGLTLYGP